MASWGENYRELAIGRGRIPVPHVHSHGGVDVLKAQVFPIPANPASLDQTTFLWEGELQQSCHVVALSPD